MSAVIKRLPFDVRPVHRETVESYSNRLLAKNFCNGTHRTDLTRTFAADQDAKAQREGWMRALTTVTKRGTLYLKPHPTGWLTDGFQDCQHFHETLPRRFACTHCTFGDTVEQNPHFDDIVCARHQRWIGLWGHADDQHRVSPETVNAQRVFEKLRRKVLIDVRLYLLVTKALAEAQHPDLSLEEAESHVFAAAITTIQAITTGDFALRFFDPSASFADAFAHLSAVVNASVGGAHPSVVRTLWIYLRPTVLALQNAINLEAPFSPDWCHDYPLQIHTAATLTAYRGELEPAGNYPAVTGDTAVTGAIATADSITLHAGVHNTAPREFTCPNGHTFAYLPPVNLPGTTTPTMYAPTCGLCMVRRVRAGDNDLWTKSPAAAAQFDIYRNGGLSAADVAASSSARHWWVCARGHSHQVSPSKKTLPTYNCPVCSNRLVHYQVNCLLTTHPDIAAMWANGWAEGHSPIVVSAGAKMLVRWRCKDGHIFWARPWELVSGRRGCNICVRERTVPYEKSLAATHPAHAARLHPSMNGNLTAEHITHGERREMWWECEKGHDYSARIDKVTLGLRCSICVSRKLRPGENDLGTVEPILSLELHPYLNMKRANEIFPSDHKLWWKCLANGHVHDQTTQNRRQSKGCPKCDSSERILTDRR